MKKILNYWNLLKTDSNILNNYILSILMYWVISTIANYYSKYINNIYDIIYYVCSSIILTFLFDAFTIKKVYVKSEEKI